MNIDLLRRVQTKILHEPKQFAMDAWECGTTRCIGGWAIVLSGEEVPEPPNRNLAIIKTLERLLDVNDSQVEDLCFEDNWPVEFRLTDEEGQYQYTTPELASKRIDVFIAEHGGAQ